MNQRLAVRLVERQGHAVVVAETGHAALDALARERFDLVLMDLQMPDMDGLEAVRAIRDLEAQSIRRRLAAGAGLLLRWGGRIPVVAVTAHAMQGDRERGLAAGMDDYVTKPIQPAALAAAIERLLPRDALPAAMVATAPTVATPSVPSLPVDLEAARRLAGGDEELRAEVAATFVQSCGQHRAELLEATRSGDWARVGRIAHALKGASSVVGATAAQQLAAEVEGLSRGGPRGPPDVPHPRARPRARPRRRVPGRSDAGAAALIRPARAAASGAPRAQDAAASGIARFSRSNSRSATSATDTSTGPTSRPVTPRTSRPPKRATNVRSSGMSSSPTRRGRIT